MSLVFSLAFVSYRMLRNASDATGQLIEVPQLMQLHLLQLQLLQVNLVLLQILQPHVSQQQLLQLQL